jgi:hypothetical protein
LPRVLADADATGIQVLPFPAHEVGLRRRQPGRTRSFQRSGRTRRRSSVRPVRRNDEEAMIVEQVTDAVAYHGEGQ